MSTYCAFCPCPSCGSSPDHDAGAAAASIVASSTPAASQANPVSIAEGLADAVRARDQLKSSRDVGRATASPDVFGNEQRFGGTPESGQIQLENDGEWFGVSPAAPKVGRQRRQPQPQPAPYYLAGVSSCWTLGVPKPYIHLPPPLPIPTFYSSSGQVKCHKSLSPLSFYSIPIACTPVDTVHGLDCVTVNKLAHPNFANLGWPVKVDVPTFKACAE